jgi:hypothetical protein
LLRRALCFTLPLLFGTLLIGLLLVLILLSTLASPALVWFSLLGRALGLTLALLFGALFVSLLLLPTPLILACRLSLLLRLLLLLFSSATGRSLRLPLFSLLLIFRALFLPAAAMSLCVRQVCGADQYRKGKCGRSGDTLIIYFHR